MMGKCASLCDGERKRRIDDQHNPDNDIHAGWFDLLGRDCKDSEKFGFRVSAASSTLQ